jgi:hypothetical protein
MVFTRKNKRTTGRIQELRDRTVVQLKQLYKELLSSPYGLKLQTVMDTRMRTGSVKEDYVQKILDMESRIQTFTESNEPFENEDTDRLKVRMERALKARKQRISNTRRVMYNGMFGKFDGFMRGLTFSF